MTSDERLTKLEKQLTRGRRLDRSFLAVLCLCLAAWALVGALPPQTASAVGYWGAPSSYDDMNAPYDPAPDDYYPKTDTTAKGTVVAILICGGIFVVLFILIPRWSEARSRAEAEPDTVPCRHCGKPALREPAGYGEYVKCSECGKTTYTSPEPDAPRGFRLFSDQ